MTMPITPPNSKSQFGQKNTLKLSKQDTPFITLFMFLTVSVRYNINHTLLYVCTLHIRTYTLHYTNSAASQLAINSILFEGTRERSEATPDVSNGVTLECMTSEHSLLRSLLNSDR